YLDAYTSGTTLEDQQLRVVITQGDRIAGIFNIPTNLSQKTISLFRVQIFYRVYNSEWFYKLVFMPDHRLVENNTTAIKSINGIPEDSVFVCSGRK
ncbi:MAG TPA: hypothetical protein P5519_12800, partial [Spirochaetia bacterium]|nr:hypothetical protein [Spirochaetia bacterium]